jgi:hypothetical protein
MNFSWCSGSGGGGAPFTATVSGTVTNLGTGSYAVYADTLGGQFPNWTDTVTQSSPNYSFSVTVLNDPQDIWVWIIDCRKDTLTQKVRVTSTRPTVSQVNFNYCGTSGGGNRASLAGMVYKGNSFPNSGFVVLYSKGSGSWAIADTTRIQRGYYFFANLDSTKWYMVRAFLDTLDSDYKKYMATYADSSAKWNKAWIGKNLQGFQNTRNIYLKKGKGKGNGPGNIRGNVIKGKSRADVPMEGVLVNLYENGVPVGFEVSDADGKFEFSGLDYGTYTIYPEEAGLTTHSYDVTLSAATPSESGVLVTMEKTEIKVSKVSTGIDNTDLTSTVSVYPNPAHTSLKVDMGDFSGLVKLTIVDLNGRIIQSLQSEDALTEVNVSDLEDGIYFLSVETEEYSELIKIVKH